MHLLVFDYVISWYVVFMLFICLFIVFRLGPSFRRKNLATLEADPD